MTELAAGGAGAGETRRAGEPRRAGAGEAGRTGAGGARRFGADLSVPLWARLLILTVLGLVSLVGSSIFFSSALHRTAERTARMTEMIGIVETAADAQVAFGDMRYWLTDLAVSLLMVSEMNAAAARDRLEARLDLLAAHDPDRVATIRTEVAAFHDDAMAAVDAYTDDNRVIGNTLLAQARIHSESVDAALTELRRQVGDDAAAEQRQVMQRADAFARSALYIVLAISAVGLALTTVVVRSIAGPLRRISEAVAALTERRYDVDLPPERGDEFGAIANTLRLFRDTAIERERLELEAERQRQRIATAIETIPDGFVLYDADERLLLTNTKYHELFPALAAAAVPGRTFRETLEIQAREADLDGQSAEEWIAERLARHRDPAGFTQDIRYGDAWLRITKRRMPDGGVVGVYTDITLLKARQEELEAARRQAESASEAKSRFLASMSHELRTPLNAIIGYSEMLIEEAQEGGMGELVPDLEKIAGSGRHLLGLINDVLDLSKIEAGKMEIYVEVFDVAAMVRDVQATVAQLIAKNGNRFVVDLAEPLGAMESDQMKIRQNLLNLLSNAAKFTENGTITLTARREARPDGDRLAFTVADTGIGMSEAQRAKLFEAFTQADSSTTRLYGGTGLGLSIARSFSEAVGGTITVESSVGEGSTFVMTIPATIPRPADGALGAAPAVGPDHVLIIDDEAAARRLIADALTEAGFASRQAASGEEGIAMARETRPLAIVLDVIMPRQDGWSVLRMLKADPELCEIPVILATVLADRDLGMALGAVEYLSKPIDAEALVAVLRSLGEERADVLVVDDDAVSRNLLRRILVKQGLQVHEATDGARGLEQMQRLRPDIVLLDLVMGEMDGFAVLSAMRRSAELRDIPVIVVTSKDLSVAERGWLRERAAAVVSKDAETRVHLVEALKQQIPRTPPAAGG